MSIPVRKGKTYVRRNGDLGFVSDIAGPPLTDEEKDAAGISRRADSHLADGTPIEHEQDIPAGRYHYTTSEDGKVEITDEVKARMEWAHLSEPECIIACRRLPDGTPYTFHVHAQPGPCPVFPDLEQGITSQP